MRLTDEQRELVEENHNLIYWYINRRKLDIEEWYDLLAIELCYTVMKYNPEKGSLSNYFKLRADGLVHKEHKKQNSQKRFHHGVSYVENIHSPISLELEGGSDFSVKLKEFVGEENSDILLLKYQGYTQSEIAEKLGISQSYVSKILKRLKDEYYEND